jgi:hypothetical protein
MKKIKLEKQIEKEKDKKFIEEYGKVLDEQENKREQMKLKRLESARNNNIHNKEFLSHFIDINEKKKEEFIQITLEKDKHKKEE